MPEPKHTVLVLGAGASVAQAKGFRPKQDRDHPPLDANFFGRAARHNSVAALEPILRRAKELGQPDLCSSTQPVSLEQYLGRLYFEMLTSGVTDNIEAYYDLVRLYATELLTTTNWMAGRRGALSKLMRAELDAGNRLSVITFNHDLLIENALAGMSANRYGRVWCLSHAYHLGSIEGTVSIPGAAQYDDDCPGRRKEHVPIYKLHGSLNWVFRTLRAYPPTDFAKQARKVMIWNNVQIPAEDNKLSQNAGRDWYLWPLVVPPVYEKQGFIFGKLRPVWDAAGDALAGADRVIFWGYSFPAADVHARYFFQGAAQGNESLRAPILINPDPTAHAALWEVVRPHSVQHFRDVRDFLATASP